MAFARPTGCWVKRRRDETRVRKRVSAGGWTRGLCRERAVCARALRGAGGPRLPQGGDEGRDGRAPGLAPRSRGRNGGYRRDKEKQEKKKKKRYGNAAQENAGNEGSGEMQRMQRKRNGLERGGAA